MVLLCRVLVHSEDSGPLVYPLIIFVDDFFTFYHSFLVSILFCFPSLLSILEFFF